VGVITETYGSEWLFTTGILQVFYGPYANGVLYGLSIYENWHCNKNFNL